MRKLFMLVAFLFVAAAPAYAQDDYPAFEAFGGYSYFSRDVSFNNPFEDDDDPFEDDDVFDQREGLHGAGFSVAGNFTRGIGVVGDFSYHKRELEVPFGDDIDLRTLTFLVGPRFTARGDRVEGFGHVLVGGINRDIENVGSDTDFAMGFGGGVDIKATDNFAVRLVQIDYIPERAQNPLNLDDEWDHNVRFQAGVTFRWGGQ